MGVVTIKGSDRSTLLRAIELATDAAVQLDEAVDGLVESGSISQDARLGQVLSSMRRVHGEIGAQLDALGEGEIDEAEVTALMERVTAAAGWALLLMWRLGCVPDHISNRVMRTNH